VLKFQPFELPPACVPFGLRVLVMQLS